MERTLFCLFSQILLKLLDYVSILKVLGSSSINFEQLRKYSNTGELTLGYLMIKYALSEDRNIVHRHIISYGLEGRTCYMTSI